MVTLSYFALSITFTACTSGMISVDYAVRWYLMAQNILLVDDDETHVLLSQLLLQRPGYTVDR